MNAIKFVGHLVAVRPVPAIKPVQYGKMLVRELHNQVQSTTTWESIFKQDLRKVTFVNHSKPLPPVETIIPKKDLRTVTFVNHSKPLPAETIPHEKISIYALKQLPAETTFAPVKEIAEDGWKIVSVLTVCFGTFALYLLC